MSPWSHVSDSFAPSEHPSREVRTGPAAADSGSVLPTSGSRPTWSSQQHPSAVTQVITINPTPGVRLQRACAACGRNKVRCDGSKPCGRCVGLELAECVYVESSRGKRRKRKIRSDPSEGEENGDEDLVSVSRTDKRDEAPRRPKTALKRGQPDLPRSERDEEYELWKRTEAAKETFQNGPNNSVLFEEDRLRLSRGLVQPPIGSRTIDLVSTEGDAHGGESTPAPQSLLFHHPASTVLDNPLPEDLSITMLPKPPTTSISEIISPGLPSTRSSHANSGIGRKPDVARDGLTTLPLPGDAPNPLAILSEASAQAMASMPSERESVGGIGGERPLEFDGVGPAGAGTSGGSASNGEDDGAAAYYAPLERILRDQAPHIMTLISAQQAKQLFDIYFKHLHPHFPILDREHTTPLNIAQRSNYLFNAICCVAARGFHVMIWERLKKGFVRYEMERLPKEKTIDIVQGQLIYSQWNLLRPKQFEQDLTWIRVGLAVRMAIDINIHRLALQRQARDDLPSWRLRNILRTWLACYIVDRKLSAQLGKPASVRGENGIRLYMELLGRLKAKGPAGIDDVWVTIMAEWTLIMTRATDSFRNEAADFASDHTRNFGLQTTALPDIIHIFARQLRRWREKGVEVLQDCAASGKQGSQGDVSGISSRQREASSENGAAQEHELPFSYHKRHLGEPELGLHTALMLASLKLYERYARLVMHSFGVQRATGSRPEADLPAAMLEHATAATRLISTFAAEFDQPGFTRGSPDFMLTMLTYASVTALKTTRLMAPTMPPSPTEGSHQTTRMAGDVEAAAVTDSHSIFELVRGAADILARAVLTADHLPASQTILVTTLREAAMRRHTRIADLPPPRAINDVPPTVNDTPQPLLHPSPSVELGRILSNAISRQEADNATISMLGLPIDAQPTAWSFVADETGASQAVSTGVPIPSNDYNAFNPSYTTSIWQRSSDEGDNPIFDGMNQDQTAQGMAPLRGSALLNSSPGQSNRNTLEACFSPSHSTHLNRHGAAMMNFLGGDIDDPFADQGLSFLYDNDWSNLLEGT